MRKKNRSRSASTASAVSAVAASPANGGLLIVVELGGEFPTLSSAEGLARKVLVQLEGEAPAAFAERVAGGLDSLFGRGVHLSHLALSCNERVDEAAQNARRKLACIALGAMAKHQVGKAQLSAPPRSSGRLRHALSALAQGLFEEWRTAGLDVSVSFGDEAPPATNAAPFAHTARVA